jgi:hypothetical protein
MGFVNVKLITFGSPPVGNAAFVKVFNPVKEENHRVVNTFDVIPSILSWSNYRHVGDAQDVQPLFEFARLAEFATLKAHHLYSMENMFQLIAAHFKEVSPLLLEMHGLDSYVKHLRLASGALPLYVTVAAHRTIALIPKMFVNPDNF